MIRSVIRLERIIISAVIAFTVLNGIPARVFSAPAELLFEDNFDGDSLDESKWERCPEQERCNGMDFWDNGLSYLDGNGLLVLESVWNKDEWRVHSGAVRTKNKFSANYGYYEASMRLPKAYGAWGAFWMMAGDVINVDGGSVDGIEIDVIESIDNEQNKCNHALHWDGYNEDAQSDSKIHEDINIYDGGFHTFAVWRANESYIFYIDGKETWRSVGGGISPEDGYMLLSMESSEAVGGGTEKSISMLPAKTEVDYVRVWNTNPYRSAYSEKDPLERIPDVKVDAENGARVTAIVRSKNENVTIIAAVYDDKMKLVGAKLQNVAETTSAGTPVEFEFNIENIAKATAFIWKHAEQ